ncbi:unnamed protein product [Pedinophyceae sp. YPF-701]|nr:unnamed protein product [Pedinophyceae sp. YPF-701]
MGACLATPTGDGALIPSNVAERILEDRRFLQSVTRMEKLRSGRKAFVEQGSEALPPGRSSRAPGDDDVSSDHTCSDAIPKIAQLATKVSMPEDMTAGKEQGLVLPLCEATLEVLHFNNVVSQQLLAFPNKPDSPANPLGWIVNHASHANLAALAAAPAANIIADGLDGFDEDPGHTLRNADANRTCPGDAEAAPAHRRCSADSDLVRLARAHQSVSVTLQNKRAQEMARQRWAELQATLPQQCGGRPGCQVPPPPVRYSIHDPQPMAHTNTPDEDDAAERAEAEEAPRDDACVLL